MTTITKRTGPMRNPAHPGEILRALYLEPLGVTLAEAAEALGVSRKHLSAIVNGRAPVSADMAVRLAAGFATDAELWVNLQAQHDLWQASRKPRPKVKALRRDVALSRQLNVRYAVTE